MLPAEPTTLSISSSAIASKLPSVVQLFTSVLSTNEAAPILVVYSSLVRLNPAPERGLPLGDVFLIVRAFRFTNSKALTASNLLMRLMTGFTISPS